MLKAKPVTKRGREIISRFEYYLQDITAGVKQSRTNDFSTKQFEKDIGPMHFHYYKSNRDPLLHFQVISRQLLAQTAQSIFKQSQIKKSENPLQSEEVEIIVLPKFWQDASVSQSSILNRSSSTTLSRKSSTISSTINPYKNPEKYTVYIAHINKQDSQSWIYFAERFTITHQDENQAVFIYEAIIGQQKETGLLNSIKSLFLQTGRSNIRVYANSFEERVAKFESILAKELKRLKIQNTHEEQLSHPSFKREDKLPISEYKKFQRMKIEVYKYYSSLNPVKKINTYSIDNLICRFLKFKEYNYDESLKGIKNYLNWQKSMRERYPYEAFEHYHKMKLYEKIGTDYEGRIILLFRPYLVFPDRIENQSQYIDFTFYMLDLFIEDNTQGYIDDFILISDYEPFGAENFKLSVAREVADKSKELFPDRQFKLVCYGLGSFSFFVYRMIKPFLPKFVLEKAAIYGSDKQQLRDFLSQYMNVDALPAEVFYGKQLREGKTSHPIQPHLQRK